MIDWNQQWELFAPNFANGYATIPLQGDKKVRLKAGPGFGDGSHPTTRLVLELMCPYIQGKNVVDLGCGTGILSIAATLLGAKQVVGIDICNESLTHARQNAEENGLSLPFLRILPQEPWDIVLFNMISSEQKLAWSEQKSLGNFQGLIVSSGVLSSQKETYLNETKQREWECLLCKESEGWMGFIFRTRNYHVACHNHSLS
jgi:ribosomal protein L11 methyltransferase